MSSPPTALVQYVLLRGDLLAFPVGALIAQACHASTAAIHLFYDRPDTQLYLSDVDRMHKVVVKSENEAALLEVSRLLTENAIDHKLWTEQPENYATCLATRPYPKASIQQYFKAFKLFS